MFPGSDASLDRGLLQPSRWARRIGIMPGRPLVLPLDDQREHLAVARRTGSGVVALPVDFHAAVGVGVPDPDLDKAVIAQGGDAVARLGECFPAVGQSADANAVGLAVTAAFS